MAAVTQGTWFVYMARCVDGTLYTGTAVDVPARIAAHNAGKGARYTRGRGPLALCAKYRCGSRGDALRLELAIKRLSRAAKLTLLGGGALSRFARALSAASSRSPGDRSRSRARVRAARTP